MIHTHPRTSLRSVGVRLGARAVVRPTLRWFPTRGPVAPTAGLLDQAMGAIPRDPRTEVEYVHGDGWKAELVRSRTSKDDGGAILYLHGGAFVFCGLRTHRKMVESLALRTGRPVLSVGYRQLPAARVEVSISDSVEALNVLLERGYDPAKIVIAGDSAGGHLAFAVALAAAEQGIGLAGVVGMSPWLEFDHSERRNHANARRDDYIPAKRLEAVARHVTGRPILDPMLSPVNRELAKLPPVLLICAASEVLRHDAELMTQRLERAGVPVDLHIWEGQVHAFPVLNDLVPESREAVRLISQFVDRATGAVRHLRVVEAS